MCLLSCLKQIMRNQSRIKFQSRPRSKKRVKRLMKHRSLCQKLKRWKFLLKNTRSSLKPHNKSLQQKSCHSSKPLHRKLKLSWMKGTKI